MKKTLIALAAFAAVAAQADVTIYGSVDGGIRSQSAADSAGNAATYVDGGGVVQSNKIGFQGSESMDGGLKASFRLESNMNIMNGTVGGWSGNGSNGSRFFDREAWVSLGDGTNSIAIGKQYSPTFKVYCAFDALKCLGGNYFNTPTSIDQGINVLSKRWDQTASYDYSTKMMSVNLTFADQADPSGAFQGVNPGSTVGRAFGGNIVLNPMDNLSVGYGHQQETVATTSNGVTESLSVPAVAAGAAAAAVSNATTANANNFMSYSGSTAAGQNLVTSFGNNTATTYNKIKDVVGVNYTVNSDWKILVNQNQVRTSATPTEKTVNTGFGFQYTPSQKLELAANYERLTQNSATAAKDGTHLTLLAGYAKYFLSKTTYVYAEFDRTQWDTNYGGAANAAPVVLAPANALSTAGVIPNSINAYTFGLNKAF